MTVSSRLHPRGWPKILSHGSLHLPGSQAARPYKSRMRSDVFSLLDAVLLQNEGEVQQSKRRQASNETRFKRRRCRGQESANSSSDGRQPPPKGSLSTAHNATCPGSSMTPRRSLKSGPLYLLLETGYGSPRSSLSSVGLCGGLLSVMSSIPS